MKDHHGSGAFNALLGIHAAVENGIFLTKGGDLVTWLKVQGLDYECLDPEEIDHQARRFESMLRIFDDRFRIYQYILKWEEGEFPGRHYADPIVEEAVAGRVRYLASKAEKLCRMDTYLAVTYEGWRPNSQRLPWARYLWLPKRPLRELLSEGSMFLRLQQELASARELLAHKVANFAVQLSDLVHVEQLDSQRTFTVLRRLLN
jgi:type IV secretory pathway VirB4 component